MLKGIPNIISPQLMYVLMSMGHGDELVLADGNFPAASIAEETAFGLVRCDGHGIPELLRAIMKFFPLDIYVNEPFALMKVVEGDKNVKDEPPIWAEYLKITKTSKKKFELVERSAFYGRAKKAFAIVATGEKALYANIILRKGVVSGES